MLLVKNNRTTILKIRGPEHVIVKHLALLDCYVIHSHH